MSRSSSRRSSSCRSTSRSRDAAQLVGASGELGAPQLQLGAQPGPAQDGTRLPGQPLEQALLDGRERAVLVLLHDQHAEHARCRAAPRGSAGRRRRARSGLPDPPRRARGSPRAARSLRAGAGRRRRARPVTTRRRCPRPGPWPSATAAPRRRGFPSPSRRTGSARRTARRPRRAPSGTRRPRAGPGPARTPARRRPSPAPREARSATRCDRSGAPPPSTITTYTSTTNIMSPASTRPTADHSRRDRRRSRRRRVIRAVWPSSAGRGRAVPAPPGCGLAARSAADTTRAAPGAVCPARWAGERHSSVLVAAAGPGGDQPQENTCPSSPPHPRSRPQPRPGPRGSASSTAPARPPSPPSTTSPSRWVRASSPPSWGRPAPASRPCSTCWPASTDRPRARCTSATPRSPRSTTRRSRCCVATGSASSSSRSTCCRP